MAVSSKLACVLDAITEPAMLVRPEDQTVAAVNQAFSRTFGGFRFEGKRCWEALHRAADCGQCGLGCPIAQAQANCSEVKIVQTLYTSSRVKKFHVSLRPVTESDGSVLYWLERIRVESGSGSQRRPGCLIGVSEEHKKLLRALEKAAGGDEVVFLQGDRGLGKELYARTIHENSSRAAQAFVVIEAAAINAVNARSMLFGKMQNQGGQTTLVPGLMAKARGGTFFVDEISRLSESVQGIIEEVLETGLFWPEGASAASVASFRFMASSRYDLQTLAQAGKMLPELARRLSLSTIRIPPLNDRRDDIVPIARYFASLSADGQPFALTSTAEELLEQADWSGNVRELREAIEGAKLHAESKVIDGVNLNVKRLREQQGMEDIFLAGAKIVPLDDIRDLYLNWAMREFNGSRAELARLLNVSERTLYRLASKAKASRKGKNADA